MLDTLDVGTGQAQSWFPTLDGNYVDSQHTHLVART